MNFSHLGWRCPSKNQRLPNKNTIPGIKSPFELLVRVFQGTPKNTDHGCCLWLPPKGRSHYCWRCHELQKQSPETPSLDLTWRPPPWGLVSRYQKVLCKLPKEGSKLHSYPDVTPMSRNNDQQGTQILVITNTSLIGVKRLIKRKTMPGTGNLVSYSVLAKPLILEENL